MSLHEKASSLIADIENEQSRTNLGSSSSEKIDEMISLLREISSHENNNLKIRGSGSQSSVYNDKTNNVNSNSETSLNYSTNNSGGGNKSQAYKYSRFSALGNTIRLRLHPLVSTIRRYISNQRFVTTSLALIAFIVLCSNFFDPSKMYSSQYTSDNTPASREFSGGGGFPGSSIMSSFSFGSKKDMTLYYNSKPGYEDQPLPLSFNLYPDGGSVICILVSNNPKDVADLQVALRSLLFLRADSNNSGISLSPVLIFNEGDLSEEQIVQIRSSTNRPIAFPIVDLSTFPPGFDPMQYEGTSQHFDVKDRKPWGYYQMIRFFVTLIWHHPAIDRYETIMRMDSDSCFKDINTHLPHMKNDHLVYHSQYVGVEPEAGKPYIQGLFDFTEEYMKRMNKSPGNVLLWHFIENTWKYSGTLPVFRTNLEISKKSFMLRSDVMKFHEALTEEPPYGLFQFRWGDAVTRFLEASIFGTDENVLTTRLDGYYHKKDCSWPEVEQALNQHGFLG